MKTIYKSILSLATLLACSCMPAWGEDYDIVTGFTADAGDPLGKTIAFTGDNMKFNQYYDRLVDGDVNYKWCCEGFSEGYVEFHHTKAMYVYGYILTTGYDSGSFPGRNPKSWKLYAKENISATQWELIHTVIDDKVMEDLDKTPFTFMLPLPTQKKYQYFRLEIKGNQGDWAMQLSEMQLLLGEKTHLCQHPKLIYHAPEQATCSSKGKMEYWECPNPLCGKLFTDEAATVSISEEEINASGDFGTTHVNLTHHEATSSTCSQQGHSEYWSCKDCGKNYNDNTCSIEIEDLSSIALPYTEGGSLPKEIEVHGKDTVDDKKNTPFYTYYENAGSQSLYLAEEIGGSMNISRISFYCTSTGSIYRTVEVYMGETTATEIDPNNVIPAESLTKVFEGSLTLGQKTGWEGIDLDKVFSYSGTKNLVVAIYNYSDSWTNNYYRTSSTSKKAITRGQDSNSEYSDVTNTNYYSECNRPVILLYQGRSHPFDKYIECNGSGYCSLCKTVEEPEKISNLALDDTKPYSRKTDAQVSSLSYTRSFVTANQWESIYLPFSFEYTEQMASQFDLAEIDTYGVSEDTNEDGVIDSKDDKVLLVQQQEIGSIFQANHPYLIRPKQTGEITFSSSDATLSKAENGTITCGTLKETLKFIGINDSFLSKGYYVMTGGQLAKSESEEDVLKSFRWYMSSSSSRTPASIRVVERGSHVHIDRNDDGQCDGCDYEFPLETKVTAENYADYGLEDYYIGYYAISKYWQLKGAMSILEDYGDGKLSEAPKFVLTNDIIANGNIFDAKGNLLNNLNEWQGGSLPGDCTFDGNGHSIKGLLFTKPTGTTVAMFDYMGCGAELCDLGIEDSYFSYTYGGYSVPMVSSFVAEMDGGAIINCWSNATIVAKTGNNGGNIGGIAGSIKGGKLKNCTFSGYIKLYDSDFAQVGGIVGSAMPNTSSGENFESVHCHYAGTFESQESTTVNFGGICGAGGNISFNCCWADGTAAYDSHINYGYWGGILGDGTIEFKAVGVSSDNYYGACVTNCANMMNFTSTKYMQVGGIVGNGYSSSSFASCLNYGNIINNNGSSDYKSQCCGDEDPSIEDVFFYLASERESQNDSTYIGYTSEDFHSGYTAREILAQCDGKYWGQNIGVDKCPIPDQENHQKVYAVEHNGTQYVNDSIAKFTVTEGYSFVNTDSAEFKAHKATYSRKMPNQWGTLCLPFSIDYDPDNTEMTLFKLTEITKEGESDVLVFEEYAEGVIAGGTPLVVKLHSAKGEDNKYTLSIEETDATFAKDTMIISCGGTNWLSKGNFVNDTIYYSTTSDNYYIAANQFWYVDAGVVNGISMAPYRGWFEAPQAQNGAVRRFVIGEKSSDSSTNIQIVENEEGHSVRIIFNLAGQRQETLQKGLNIINNEKVLNK